MFGAAAVRNKKKKSNAAPVPRGPYIKPFGPRFDPSELPYFKYKRALAEAKELQQNISQAKKAKARSIAKGQVAKAPEAPVGLSSVVVAAGVGAGARTTATIPGAPPRAGPAGQQQQRARRLKVSVKTTLVV